MIIVNIKKKIEISKAGNPFARVLVQFEEYKDGKGNLIWISGFGNKRTWAWNRGDDVNPEITQNGQYYNFSFDDTQENRLDVYTLPATVGLVMDLIKGAGVVKTKPAQVEEKPEPVSTQSDEEITPDDIPF